VISLVGFMGCGKSTLGPLLALCLNQPFRDLDRVVEEETGRSVTQLFETEGEAGFRIRELRAFQRLRHTFDGVLATGGGFPCTEEAVGSLRGSGPVLFLDPPWPVLRERLASPGGRPLAEALAPDQLESLYRERLPWYQRAGRRVELPAGEDPARQLDRLLRALKEAGGAVL